MKKLKWLPLVLSGAMVAGCMSLEERLQSNDPQIKQQAEYELIRTSYGANRISAIQRLTDEEVISSVAISAEGPQEKDGLCAVKKLKTESNLANVAAHAKSLAVSKEALTRVKDQDKMAGIAMSTRSSEIFDMVIKQCDQQRLMQLATKHPSLQMRALAIAKIDDENTRKELKAKIDVQLKEVAKKQSSKATAYILSNLQKTVHDRNGRYDDNGYKALTQQLKNALQQVTEISDLEKIAQQCNAWRGWEGSGHKLDFHRGRLFDEVYLPERFTDVCKDPKDIITFITEGFWNVRPNEKQRAALLASIKDEKVLFELASKGAAESKVQVWNAMPDEMFAKFASNMPHSDAHYDSERIQPRLQKISDEKIQIQLLAKAKSAIIRHAAMNNIRNSASYFDAACNFDFTYDSTSCSPVEAPLLKKLSDNQVIELLKKNPKFMSSVIYDIRNPEIAKYLLHNYTKLDNPIKDFACRDLIRILDGLDKAEFEKCVNIAKKHAKAQNSGVIVFGDFYLGMPVFDYVVLLKKCDGLQKHWHHCANDNYKVDNWLTNWKTTSIELPRTARYKLLGVEENIKGLDQFVCKYIRHTKPAPEGTFAKAAQDLKNYQDYHIESVEGDMYWTYKDLKTMTEVRLFTEGGELIVVKLD